MSESTLCMKNRVLAAIPQGSWKSARLLAGEFGIDERTLRDVISSLRRDGHPICSGNKGYMFSHEPEDLKEAGNRLMSHGFDEIERGKAMIRLADKIVSEKNQLKMAI